MKNKLLNILNTVEFFIVVSALAATAIACIVVGN